MMDAYDFLKSKIGYFNSNHPVGTMLAELPDWGDIVKWMEEYVELKNPDLRRDRELNRIADLPDWCKCKESTGWTEEKHCHSCGEIIKDES